MAVLEWVISGKVQLYLVFMVISWPFEEKEVNVRNSYLSCGFGKVWTLELSNGCQDRKIVLNLTYFKLFYFEKQKIFLLAYGSYFTLVQQDRLALET